MTTERKRNMSRLAVGGTVAAFLLGAAIAGMGRSEVAIGQGPQMASEAPVAMPATPSLAPLVRKVAPGVVNISVEGKVAQTTPQLPDDPFFRRFFNIPDQPAERDFRSAGSGVIVDAEKGYVLTNAHVVDDADHITVGLADERKLEAKVLGKDPEADVAVIQIPAKDLTALQLGNSDRLEVGDYVVAIGNPFGLNHTVTAGIVSAVGRSGLNIEGYEDFIQTDASINPGNSGGALVNLEGELVGINTAIIGPNGGNVGIGFAIPINMVEAIMTQLIEHGKVERGQLGVLVQDMTPDVAEAMGLDTHGGALVSKVEGGTPAARAGIKAGDVIVTLDGTPLRDGSELRNRIGLMPVGSQVRLGVVRSGKTLELQARLAPREVTRRAGTEVDARFAGVEFSVAADQRGIVVASIDEQSRAYASGLRKDDVISALNQQPVRTLEELSDVLHRSPGAVLLQVTRGSETLVLVLR